MLVREKRRFTKCEVLTSAAVIALTLIGVNGQTAQADTVPVENSVRRSGVVPNGEKQSKVDSRSDEMDSSIPKGSADNTGNNDINNDDSLDTNANQVAGESASKAPVSSNKLVTAVSENQGELEGNNSVDEHSSSLSFPKDDRDSDDTAIARSIGPESAAVEKEPVPTIRTDTETIDQWMPNKRLQQAILKNLNALGSGKHWQSVADISQGDMLLLKQFNNDNTYIDGKTEYSLKGLEYAKNLTGIILNTSTNTDSHGVSHYQGDVRDISTLANLTKLTSLDIQNNQVSDISVLSNLTNLTHFDASMNYIGDFRPVANLPKLIPEANGNQFVKLPPIYVDRQKLTGHIVGNYYSSDGKKIILDSTPGVGEPVWIDANGELYARWYPLIYLPKGENNIPGVTKDGDGGLNFTNIQEQESGNKLPSIIGPTHVIYQKDLLFLLGQYRVGQYVYLSVVQPYILSDKAATVTVHYQDEAGKALAEDRVLNDGYIGEAYTTSPLKIKGYTFKEVKDHNATGQYTAKPQTVVYIYTVDDSGHGGGNNGGPDPETPVVPVAPAPQAPEPIAPSEPTPSEPAPTKPSEPTEPTPVASSVPDMLNEASVVAGSAGAAIQGIAVKVSVQPLTSAKRPIPAKAVPKTARKATPVTLPQTNEQKDRITIWGLVVLALSSLGAIVFRRYRS